ncbi:MAG: phosphatase PAP2 family protein [Acidimicrobiales bacterium]|nr:phosphatase PAP2 family protein [Acidimicrobiales bacterium]
MNLARFDEAGWRLTAVAAGLTVAAGLVATRSLVLGEVAVTETINSLPSLAIDGLEVVMQLGTRPAILLVAVVAVVVTPGDWRRIAFAVVVAGALSWLGSDLAKDIVERPRPGGFAADVDVRDHATGFGWPSTHTAIAAGSLTAAALAGRRGVAPALVVAGTVGIARMAVGVHLPLDIVGGLALGVAIASAVVAVVDP